MCKAALWWTSDLSRVYPASCTMTAGLRSSSPLTLTWIKGIENGWVDLQGLPICCLDESILCYSKPYLEHLALMVPFYKCCWVHAVISMTESCLFLMQCCRKACSSQASSIDLQPCPLPTEMFPHSPNLLLMLCSVDVLLSAQFFNVFLQIAEPLHNFNYERPCLAKVLFLPSHVTDLLPVSLICCCIVFLQLFLFLQILFCPLLLSPNERIFFIR